MGWCGCYYLGKDSKGDYEMSYYYNYYLGYIKDKKFYPLGPFDCFGNLKPVVSRSSSGASDLHERFWPMRKDQASDELKKHFEYENWDGEKVLQVKFLAMNELPSTDFVKTGYFLIEDVKAYEKQKADGSYWNFDGFFDVVDPVTYVAMVKNEVIFGLPNPTKDDFGNEYTPHSARDYMYYAYPDYESEEYEASLIQAAFRSLENYGDLKKAEVEYVVLEDEG